MTDTLETVAPEEQVDQQQLAEQLLAQAKEQRVELVGPGGLVEPAHQVGRPGPECAPRGLGK